MILMILSKLSHVSYGPLLIFFSRIHPHLSSPLWGAAADLVCSLFFGNHLGNHFVKKQNVINV